MAADDTLPFGDATDDAVVAMLDGRLADFAAEQGITEAEARERLEQWPGLGTRISTIVAARRGVRTPRRRPKNLGLVVGILIAVMAVAAVAIVVIVRSGSSDEKAEAPHVHIMDAYIGSIGEIGTDDALRTAVQRRGPVDDAIAQDPTNTSILTGSGLSIAAERCVRVTIPGKSVDLLASGTWKGQPVVIFTADVTGAQVAFVTDLSGCAVLYSLRV